MIKVANLVLAGCAVSVMTTAAAAQPSVVDLDTALRCSAAFGIVAQQQARGAGSALTDYPAMNQRGREFFVQTGARLMDLHKLDRPAVQQRMQAEVARLQSEISAAADPAAQLKGVMGPCLSLLDITVPPRR